MQEFKTGKATVRIHGAVNKQLVEESTINYLKRVIKCRKQKEREETKSLSE